MDCRLAIASRIAKLAAGFDCSITDVRAGIGVVPEVRTPGGTWPAGLP
jgi:hypothetical protein